MVFGVAGVRLRRTVCQGLRLQVAGVKAPFYSFYMMKSKGNSTPTMTSMKHLGCFLFAPP